MASVECNPNATVEIAKKAYSGFRLESTIKEGGLNQADLTSKDMYYTKDQMRSLIQECRALGIDIVPEFDTPAHSLALTKVRPDLIYEETLAGVDHLNLHTKYDETISFVQSIFNDAMDGLTAGGAPETTDKPETSQKPEGTDKPQATEQPENVPQTGDSAQLMLYVAALAGATLLLGTAAVARKRRG